MNPSAPQPRHARRTPPIRAGVVAGLTVVASLILGSTATVTAAVTGPQPLADPVASTATMMVDRVDEKVASMPAPRSTPPLPAPAQAIPTPQVAAAPAVIELCALHGFADALAVGDDVVAVAAAGGPEAFRRAVATGMAPCVNLADPARVWTVINKARPLAPLDYRPGALAMPEGVRSIEGGSLRSDAAAALSAMVAAAAAAGVGEIALESGFRSHTTQETSYGNQVSARGVELADLSSARPGFSEHQSGLAADVVACSDGCGTLDDLAGSAQGQWIAAHAWEFGWITRYEDGYTPITGYSPEPWHLRYIGPELARAYHDGGWHTLEEFLGLPAAPGYLG
ncbi:D-alanyl-D-alanine carboxypeptidase family protein [Microbacterium terregens]|uniref:D-alanyl-D-alanine carboxypeptidase family protein n=1 Tax=Microbacterium terregens TaxID=69363 RepID=A0ABV5SWA6_9MICO